MIHYPSGTPLWVDLASPDIDASVAFYANLFGWEVSRTEQTGDDYRMFCSGGKIVSGIRALQSELQLPQWITYISTDDVSRVVSRVEAAGGKILMETGIRSEAGMKIFQDPVGAVFGVFQDDLFGGAQMFNQPVALTFNLLMTYDPLAGKQFYSEVFGWESLERKIGSLLFTYFFNGGRGVAGVMAMSEQELRRAVSSHWQVSFAVENADLLALRANELGGKAQSPITTPFGRSALITDPHGATFSISQQTPQVREAAQTLEGVLL